MKKLFYLLAAVLLTFTGMQAQNYDVLDEVMSSRLKAAGMEGAYRYEEHKQTPAPRGYKPFYISHYGRHGSRYAWTSRAYTNVFEVLKEAHASGNLTTFGESFYSRFEDFIAVPVANTGDLVPLGAEQHAAIARKMAADFPKVFAGKGKVDAISSTTGRCIVSMASFCTALQKEFPKLDINVASTHVGMLRVAPPSAPEGFIREFKGSDIDSLPREKLSEFIARKVDVNGIMGHIFKDPKAVKNPGGSTDFLYYLYMFMGNYPNYTDPELFADVLTDEQYCSLWEVFNYNSYLEDIVARYRMIPLLEDIVDRADAAIGGKDIAADLRFGHDYVLEAFISLLNLDNFGTIPDKADDVKYWFQSYRICKATNLQFVFYGRGRDKSDVLFKILWNGEETDIPALQPVSGPYYRWSDFRQFAADIIREHPQTGVK